MNKVTFWKWLILVGLVMTSCLIVYKYGIPKGLDIAGGASFVIKIDSDALRVKLQAEALESKQEMTEAQLGELVERRIKEAQNSVPEIIRNRIDGLGISESSIYADTTKNRIIIQLPGIGPEKTLEAKKAISDVAYLEFRMCHMNNDTLTRTLFSRDMAPKGFRIERIQNNPVYVRDTTVKDADIDRVALRKFGVQEVVRDSAYEFLLEKRTVQGIEGYYPHFVNRRPDLTGDRLKSAGVDYQSAMPTPMVSLTFDAQGARKFEMLTADFAPGGMRNPDPQHSCYLAIVLDGTLYSAPRIKTAIAGGSAVIEGNFKESEARQLANVLRAGALPVPVKFEEMRMVDPTLGKDAVSSGLKAAIGGCLAIVVLMALYYMIPGLFADIALGLNVVLLPLSMLVAAGILSMVGKLFGADLVQQGKGDFALPVLTLPGIAGIALSIGMAVDANVLIFERIREELRGGKGFVAAVQAGYDRAFTAIFDSNITTILTAVIMFVVGTGPVRGYAITLTAGLLASLYTAVMVTRMIFDALATRTSDTGKLRMVSMFKVTNINFMGIWKIPLAISLIIITVSWAVMVLHARKDPASVFGVDFTGGSSVTLTLGPGAEKVDVETVRGALTAAGVKDPTIQYQTDPTAGKEYLQVRVGNAMVEGTDGTATDQSTVIQKTLVESFPKAGFIDPQSEDVGPQIGKELKRKAVYAMAAALVAMIIYISIRFEFGFALGAVVALFHDVIITAGIVHVLGIQMSMTVMAALLTIIGYSVNDTIVIFDRIREDLRLTQGKKFVDICNLGMNQTLSRTLLTNFLTFISVLALVVFGGGAIKDFSVTMFIGMIAGTYSTMYIATPVVLLWYGFKTPDLGRARVK